MTQPASLKFLKLHRNLMLWTIDRPTRLITSLQGLLQLMLSYLLRFYLSSPRWITLWDSLQGGHSAAALTLGLCWDGGTCHTARGLPHWRHWHRTLWRGRNAMHFSRIVLLAAFCKARADWVTKKNVRIAKPANEGWLISAELSLRHICQKP